MDILSLKIPPEIWLQILSSLPHRQLLKLRLVCKLFDQLVLRHYSSLTAVSFSWRSPWEVPSAEPFSSYLRLNLVILKLKSRDIDISLPLRFLKKYCPQLEMLDLPTAKVSQLIPFGPRLKFMRIRSLVNDVSDLDPEEIIKKFPRLMAFDVVPSEFPFCIRYWASKANNNFGVWRSPCRHTQCSSLDYQPKEGSLKCLLLNLSHRHNLTFNLTSFTQTIELLDLRLGLDSPMIKSSFCFPNLEYFGLNYVGMLDTKIVMNFLNSATKLSHMNIRAIACRHSTSLTLLSLVHSRPNLRSADIHFRAPLDPDDENEFITFEPCKKTKMLVLSYSAARINESHLTLIKGLMHSSPHLGVLDISSACTSLDAIDFRYSDRELQIMAMNPILIQSVIAMFRENYYPIEKLVLREEGEFHHHALQEALDLPKLRYISGKYADCFMIPFLNQLSQSKRTEGFQVDFHDSTPTRGMRLLLRENVKNGLLVSYQGVNRR